MKAVAYWLMVIFVYRNWLLSNWNCSMGLMPERKTATIGFVVLSNWTLLFRQQCIFFSSVEHKSCRNIYTTIHFIDFYRDTNNSKFFFFLLCSYILWLLLLLAVFVAVAISIPPADKMKCIQFHFIFFPLVFSFVFSSVTKYNKKTNLHICMRGVRIIFIFCCCFWFRRRVWNRTEEKKNVIFFVFQTYLEYLYFEHLYQLRNAERNVLAPRWRYVCKWMRRSGAKRSYCSNFANSTDLFVDLSLLSFRFCFFFVRLKFRRWRLKLRACVHGIAV